MIMTANFLKKAGSTIRNTPIPIVMIARTSESHQSGYL